jgi:curved DNA-binding protein CbpA
MYIKNPYKILGVETNTPLEECRKAYRKLCRKYHPDNGGDPDLFDEINKAWELIQSGKFKDFSIKRNSLQHETLFTFV